MKLVLGSAQTMTVGDCRAAENVRFEPIIPNAARPINVSFRVRRRSNRYSVYWIPATLFDFATKMSNITLIFAGSKLLGRRKA